MHRRFKSWKKLRNKNKVLGGSSLKNWSKKIILGIFIILGMYPIALLAESENLLALPAISTEKNSQIAIGEAELQRLKKGNAKYIEAAFNKNPIGESVRKSLYEKGQKPYAIILTCSDSRVVPEDIFYTGLGELFVIRVAGNVVDAIVLGSIEYGVEELNIPLIVVMGHQNCGAVEAAKIEKSLSGDLKKLVSKIIPSYKKAEKQGGSEQEILNQAIINNVNHSIIQIKENKVIADKLKANEVKVIGAYYSLETGEVIFNTL